MPGTTQAFPSTTLEMKLRLMTDMVFKINFGHLSDSIWVKGVDGLGCWLSGAGVIFLVQSVLSKYINMRMRTMMLAA